MINKKDLLAHGDKLAESIVGSYDSGHKISKANGVKEGFTAAVELLWPLVELNQWAQGEGCYVSATPELVGNMRQALSSLEQKLEGEK